MRRTETEAEYEAISQPVERRVLVFPDEADPTNPWGAWVPETEVGDRRRWGE